MEHKDGRFKKGQIPWNKGKFKADAPYRQLHKWLRRNLGSANRCQNVSCENKSLFFDWAKLPECAYEHKFENYIQLCRKCHKQMDVKKVVIQYAI